ncbi:MAG: hypothetical protein UFA98_02175 [Ruminococcus sp.]|nr:hypothetical protein [Ruminococcus sp.]
MKCSRCGNENSGFSSRCAKCGARLNGKGKIKKMVIAVVIIMALSTAVVVLDYNDILPLGISKSSGLRSSGSFELECDKTVVPIQKDIEDNKIKFSCKKLYGVTNAQLYRDGQKVADFSAGDKDLFTAEASCNYRSAQTVEFKAVMREGSRYYESNVIKIEVK